MNKTKSIVLHMAFSGREIEAIFHSICRVGLAPAGSLIPNVVKIDNKQRKLGGDWLNYTKDAKRYFRVKWQEPNAYAFFDRTCIVELKVSQHVLDIESFIDRLSGVPFELASLNTIHPMWSADGFGFGDGHYPHGWAAIFRQGGHDRLVSRRWLEHGPWKLHKGPNDTSLVQFHDLDVDAETAAAQAEPGHRRMGISGTGGFFQEPMYLTSKEAPGTYVFEDKALVISVYGTEVTQRSMLEAAYIRRKQLLGPDRPLERVIYSFADEKEARAHLHELWLRELECVTYVDGYKVNLTDDYHPEPVEPEWVINIGD